MLAIILLTILLAVAYFFYRYYFKPKADIKRYVKIFQSLGYSVYQQKFSFLGVSFGNIWSSSEKLYRDALYIEKNVYSQVDISIGNILDRVQVVLINPNLTQSFLSPAAVWKYPKFDVMILTLRYSLGEGLALSEGEDWKVRKKVLSKVFTFDLVKGNIPMMASICDRWLE